MEILLRLQAATSITLFSYFLPIGLRFSLVLCLEIGNELINVVNVTYLLNILLHFPFQNPDAGNMSLYRWFIIIADGELFRGVDGSTASLKEKLRSAGSRSFRFPFNQHSIEVLKVFN